jgi:hypothetical protein
VNAKIGEYLGTNYWNTSTTKGGNIQKACDFLMTVTLNTTDGDGPIDEPYSSIVAVGSKYGDPNGKYSSFLANADPQYPAQPYFLWNQPFSDSGLPAAMSGPSTQKSDALRLYFAPGTTFFILYSAVLFGLMQYGALCVHI